MQRLWVIAAAVVLAAGLVSRSSDATPACFGAAARDLEHPCVNHRLDFVAIPSPRDALLQPNAGCEVLRRRSPEVCGFGVSQRAAGPSFALLGDSHALHWLAALAVMARRERARGVSLTHHRCPFSLARKPTIRCLGWVRSAVAWLTGHPEVHTVFVSADADSSVVAPPGQAGATKLSGFVDAWRSLPASVHEVFVLHDVPQSAYLSVGACIDRAVARHRNPGLRCSRPRGPALHADEEAAAAAQLASPRVKVVDLTPFMCDEQRCFPVVGGALVIKDHGHLTRTFSATLGPFVQRAVELLRAGGR
jgi:hypothetical protein